MPWTEEKKAKQREYNRRFRAKNLEHVRRYWRLYMASHPQKRARKTLLAQEWNARHREWMIEVWRKSYHKRKAEKQAEWNEIMAEIQGEANV